MADFTVGQFFIAVSSKNDVLKPAARMLFPLLSTRFSGGFDSDFRGLKAAGLLGFESLAAFFAFWRKKRRRSIENFPAGFCWLCRFSDRDSADTVNFIIMQGLGTGERQLPGLFSFAHPATRLGTKFQPCR